MELSSEDRRWFDSIAAIIFSNPFDEPDDAIRDLVPAQGGVRAARGARASHPFAALAPVLDERLGALEAAGIRSRNDVTTRDRELLGYLLLFRIYHRYVDRFDALITEQHARGDEPVPVDFADALLGELAAAGFDAAEADRSLALFYQLRRAYYFIADALLGDSPAMKRLRHALWNNVFSCDIRVYDRHLWNRMEDFSTLVLGETGTGKTAAAAAIGRSGLIPFERKRGRFAASFTSTFVAANLSQYSENLIESELFGHRKGAFTGAIDNHQGLFERLSNYGALFLDEIGEVSVPIQIKLLTVLEERRFSPVGSHEQLTFQGRVIAATNRPLAALRASDTFREDFLYRLCSDVVEVPPLRLRIEQNPAELEQLVSLLVARATGEDTPELARRVTGALRDALPRDYPWPGNVRELEQAVRRVLLTGRYEGLELVQKTDEEAALAGELRDGEMTATELTSRYCRLLYERLGSYEQVARRIDLDRRTVKKYIDRGAES